MKIREGKNLHSQISDTLAVRLKSQRQLKFIYFDKLRTTHADGERVASIVRHLKLIYCSEIVFKLPFYF